MKPPLVPYCLLIAIAPLFCTAHETIPDDADPLTELIVITGHQSQAHDSDIDAQRVSSSDPARMLENFPGVSLYRAGGISSLPVIHGMADDRIGIQVDGMNLMPSCPNHMNPPLSVIDPASVRAIAVIAGISPVSAGGDSIAGSIQVSSPKPVFASNEESTTLTGMVGAFYRSNGDARGANFSASYVGNWFNLSYYGSTAQSNNILAAHDFKAGSYAAIGRAWLAGDVIGSTAYQTENNQLRMAMRHDDQILEFSVSQQDVPVELFPNQRMDMTENVSRQFNLHYLGQVGWSEIDARIYQQLTNHAMDFGSDKQAQYGMAAGMPMKTEGNTRGLSAKATMPFRTMDTMKVGAEFISYALNDWWPPATATSGMMGPSTFQNVNNARRNRRAVFVEWDGRWNRDWESQLGLRSEQITMDTDDVQGYNAMPIYAGDASAFNAEDHNRTDHHLDLIASLRFVPNETGQVEFGYAQKSRSPNLYERYTWSAFNMAAIMNNFVGDGNGYIGNQHLRPEVAHTLSATWQMQSEDHSDWQLKLTPYATRVTDFIDATRCPLSYSINCTQANLYATTGFVTLQYANQTAQLVGADLSGFKQLGKPKGVGRLKLTGVVNLVRGKNLDTNDNLYNIMPTNAKLRLIQEKGRWSNTLEWQLVAKKDHVSAVRNENQTAGYGLVNVHSSYDWKLLKIETGIENLFNRFYEMPLGGAYVGHGATMGINSVPWGVPVPGNGRSINTTLTMQF